MTTSVEATVVVGEDRTITVKLPDDVPPGEWQVFVTLHAVRPPANQTGGLMRDWPAHSPPMENPNELFRREDLY